MTLKMHFHPWMDLCQYRWKWGSMEDSALNWQIDKIKPNGTLEIVKKCIYWQHFSKLRHTYFPNRWEKQSTWSDLHYFLLVYNDFTGFQQIARQYVSRENWKETWEGSRACHSEQNQTNEENSLLRFKSIHQSNEEPGFSVQNCCCWGGRMILTLALTKHCHGSKWYTGNSFSGLFLATWHQACHPISHSKRPICGMKPQRGKPKQPDSLNSQFAVLPLQ